MRKKYLIWFILYKELFNEPQKHLTHIAFVLHFQITRENGRVLKQRHKEWHPFMFTNVLNHKCRFWPGLVVCLRYGNQASQATDSAIKSVANVGETAFTLDNIGLSAVLKCANKQTSKATEDQTMNTEQRAKWEMCENKIAICSSVHLKALTGNTCLNSQPICYLKKCILLKDILVMSAVIEILTNLRTYALLQCCNVKLYLFSLPVSVAIC